MKKATLSYELGEIKRYLSEALDEAWKEWLEEQLGDRWNLHIFRGEDESDDDEGTIVQFNSFGDDFIYCVSLDEVIKSAIDCNDGKEDLLAIANDLRTAADRLTKAAKKSPQE